MSGSWSFIELKQHKVDVTHVCIAASVVETALSSAGRLR
jgi:hypothetical protein